MSRESNRALLVAYGMFHLPEHYRSEVERGVDEFLAVHDPPATEPIAPIIDGVCDECGFRRAKGNVVYEDSGRRPPCKSCNAPQATETFPDNRICWPEPYPQPDAIPTATPFEATKPEPGRGR